jgi:hypothetical protein
MSIDILLDDVLLAIFDLYVDKQSSEKAKMDSWQSLVHVCRQWRSLVFGSPRRLNLRLYCATKTRTPLRDTLDVWPALPLVIQGDANEKEEVDNIVAVLERSDRVYQISLKTSRVRIWNMFWQQCRSLSRS